MSNETIEQKTCRLAIEVRPQILDYRNQITVATFYYKQVEKMIELAIAEEREANGWISVKDRLPEWASRDDTLCEIDGKKVGALLTSEKVLVVIAPHNTVRIDHLTAIESSNGERQHKWFDMYRDRVRYWSLLPAAPKAEVSE